MSHGDGSGDTSIALWHLPLLWFQLCSPWKLALPPPDSARSPKGQLRICHSTSGSVHRVNAVSKALELNLTKQQQWRVPYLTSLPACFPRVLPHVSYTLLTASQELSLSLWTHLFWVSGAELGPSRRPTGKKLVLGKARACS